MDPLPKMRPRDVDMSPEAIDLRLRQCSDLTKLCISLSHAKRLGTVKEIRERERLAELEKQAAAIQPETETPTSEHRDQKETD